MEFSRPLFILRAAFPAIPCKSSCASFLAHCGLSGAVRAAVSSCVEQMSFVINLSY